MDYTNNTRRRVRDYSNKVSLLISVTQHERDLSSYLNGKKVPSALGSDSQMGSVGRLEVQVQNKINHH